MISVISIELYRTNYGRIKIRRAIVGVYYYDNGNVFSTHAISQIVFQIYTIAEKRRHYANCRLPENVQELQVGIYFYSLGF